MIKKEFNLFMLLQAKESPTATFFNQSNNKQDLIFWCVLLPPLTKFIKITTNP